MTEIPMLLVKHFGEVSKNKRGWSKEFNLISWNGRKPKFDVREWSEDRKKSSKGLTLTLNEIIALKDIFVSIDFSEFQTKDSEDGGYD